MNEKTLTEIVALATVLARQHDRLQTLLGEINDLRCSDPTIEDVEELAKTFDGEQDFARYALIATDELLQLVRKTQ